MTQKKITELTNEIVAIALVELNGFSEDEAKEKAPENAGHPFYDRIKELLEEKLS